MAWKNEDIYTFEIRICGRSLIFYTTPFRITHITNCVHILRNAVRGCFAHSGQFMWAAKSFNIHFVFFFRILISLFLTLSLSLIFFLLLLLLLSPPLPSSLLVLFISIFFFYFTIRVHYSAVNFFLSHVSYFVSTICTSTYMLWYPNPNISTHIILKLVHK